MDLHRRNQSPYTILCPAKRFHFNGQSLFHNPSPRAEKSKKRQTNHFLFRLFSLFIILSLLFCFLPPLQVSALAPIVEASDTPRVYDSDPILVDPFITVNDNGNIFTSATVIITNNFVSGEDYLMFLDDAQFTSSYNDVTGVLTLTGNGNGADYQEAFRRVYYANYASGDVDEQPRTILFVLGGNTLYSDATGHFYEWVDASGISWEDAKTRAASLANYGNPGYPVGLYEMQGYLVTVTSAVENTFVTAKLTGQGWMGASDADVNKVWRWKTGPEGLMDGGKGLLFFRQEGWDCDTCANGSGVGPDAVQPAGTYYNWASGEPNDYPNGTAHGEDMAHFYPDGLWNDYAYNNSGVVGYVVEYGGMPGDPTLQLMDSVVVNFTSNPNALPEFSETGPVEVNMNVNGNPVLFSLTLHASDADAETLTWSVSTPALHGTASASGTGTSKSIGYVPATDYAGTDSFTVKVTDTSGGSATIRVLVTIEPDNYAPTDISLSNASVDENQPSGTSVGIFSTTDPDAGDTFTYSLVNGTGDTNNTAFSISGSSLLTAAAFNFETKSGYSIRVRTTDQDGLWFDEIFSISVANVNEAPVITSNGGGATASVSVAENTTVITTVTATDVDAGTTLSYSLAGGVDSSSFNLNSSSGALSFKSPMDYETKADANGDNVYEVTVQASDGFLIDTQQIAVTVTDANDSPYNMAISSSLIAENVPAGSAIGAFSTSDPDAGNTFTYTLVSGDGSSGNGSFSISNGVLYTGIKFDHETQSSYSIRVRTTDQGSLWYEEIFTITITNLNEAPDITSNGGGSTAGFFVPENSTSVTTVTAVDPDADTTLSFSILDGADAALFNLNSSSGVLTFKTKPDYETRLDANADNFYEVRVEVSDGSLSDFQSMSISIQNVNENPTDLALSPGSVPENLASGTGVGSFTTTDPDADNIFSYTLVSGIGSTDNSSFNIIGDVLYTGAAFDFELQSSYSIRVRTTDQGGLTFEKVFTITVTDGNDAPLDILLSNGSVDENQPSGTTVGTLSTIDIDSWDSFTYTLVSGTGSSDNNLFQITGEALKTAQIFDYEADSSYSIRVRSTDAGGAWYEKEFTIQISDVNESPVINSDGGSDTANLTVSENSTAVTTVTATDPELDTITYSILGGPDQDKFSCDPLTGVLTFTSAPDFETKADFNEDNVYEVEVEAGDGALSDTQVILATVTNVNESPAGVLLDDAQVDENQPAGTVVGMLTNTDPDSSDSFIYELVDGDGSDDNGLFQISGVQLRTAAVFDYEEENSYTVRIRVEDEAGLQAENSFALTITDVNDAPALDALIPDQTGQIGSAFSFAFDPLIFSDEDGDTLTYSASLADGSALPTWLVFSGDVRLFAGTPAETDQGTIEVKVTADDGQGGSASDTFFISISTADNVPPVQNYPLPDQVIEPGAEYSFTLEADVFTDPDSSQPLVYSVLLSDGSALPTWLSFDPETRTFSGTVPPGTTDLLTIRVTVFDADGGQTANDFVLSFSSTAENQPPFLKYHLVDQNAVSGQAFSYTFAANLFNDPDGDALTYTALLDTGETLPAWLTFDSETRTFSGTPADADVGSFLVKLTASDGIASSPDAFVRIAVSNSTGTLLFKVISPSGMTFTYNHGQVVVPAGVIPLGTHSYLTVELLTGGPQAPEGYQSLKKKIEVHLYQGQDQLLETFNSPVQVCYKITGQQVKAVNGEDIRIGTTPSIQEAWSFMSTEVVNGNQACAETTHFSLFDLFAAVQDVAAPATGFAPGVVTALPERNALNTYLDLGTLRLEIPSLGIDQSIVGVYPQESGWDISWLGQQVGWLNSTAFPTWKGNSVLTGHVVDQNGLPGIFFDLSKLKYGDQIIIQLAGLKYVYEVRTVDVYADPQDNAIFQHEDLPWLTLVTCKLYDEDSREYLYRTVVRAVQVEITH